MAHGLTLVTHNTPHFADVPGIVLEDWVQEYEDGQQDIERDIEVA